MKPQKQSKQSKPAKKAAKTSKKKTKLANPVTSLANMISSLFDGNGNISTQFNFNRKTLRIVCQSRCVATALAEVCADHFEMGSLYLDVQFLYLDGRGRKRLVKDVTRPTDPEDFAASFANAFGDCASYGGVMSSEDPFQTTWHYLLGSKVVCQWDNDDTSNPWGVSSSLPEHVFAHILRIPNGVRISTTVADRNEKAGKKR